MLQFNFGEFKTRISDEIITAMTVVFDNDDENNDCSGDIVILLETTRAPFARIW